jgi:hypothetical protein
MTNVLESRLAAQLSDALSLLHTLESYKIGEAPGGPYGTDGGHPIDEVKVSFRAGWASNGKDAQAAMEKAVTAIVADGIVELIETAVANQRMVVADARKALLEFQFDAMKQGIDTSLATHDAAPTNGEDKSETKPAPIAAEILGEEVYF